MELKPIMVGRKLSFEEYNRRWYSFKPNNFNIDDPGNLVSPRGNVWRPCGRYTPGLLLVNYATGRQHSVCWGTLWHLLSHGWIWRPDNKGKLPKFSIYRWPDGTHYYLLNESGDPIGEKHDTWNSAWLAGTLWANKQ